MGGELIILHDLIRLREGFFFLLVLHVQSPHIHSQINLYKLF